jgi:peroxiredoxin
LAEYRDRYRELKASGVDLVAISVDDASRSAPIKAELGLPFPILSDSGRELITRWGLLNRKEMGGIAYPAVFAIDSNLVVRFHSVDSTTRRASAAQVAATVRAAAQGSSMSSGVARQRLSPGLMFLRALRNALSRGAKTPWSERA